MIRQLNHAVLYVRDARASASFYTDVLGFEVVSVEAGGRAVFLRGADSDNHHDLGLFSVGAHAPSAPSGSPGLYHLAWEVASMSDLVALRGRLVDADALVGQSDHGVSKSLYARDPDGIEFEIAFIVPRADWGEHAERAVVGPLDIDAELARYG